MQWDLGSRGGKYLKIPFIQKQVPMMEGTCFCPKGERGYEILMSSFLSSKSKSHFGILFFICIFNRQCRGRLIKDPDGIKGVGKREACLSPNPITTTPAPLPWGSLWWSYLVSSESPSILKCLLSLCLYVRTHMFTQLSILYFEHK